MLEEQIEEEQREAAKASTIEAAVDASVAATAAAAELTFPKDSLIASGGLTPVGLTVFLVILPLDSIRVRKLGRGGLGLQS